MKKIINLSVTILYLFVSVYQYPVFVNAQTDPTSIEVQRKYIELGVEFFDTESSGSGVCSTSGSTGVPSTDSGGGSASEKIKKFVDMYGQMAYDNSITSGIPYEFTLAQAILESGYGESGLTKEANNFFGIKKGTGWTGEVVMKRTREVIDGVSQYVIAPFRKYASPQDSFADHDRFLRVNQRYAAAFQYPHDPYKFLEEVKAAGYATDPNYVSSVGAVIRQVQEYIASSGKWPPSSQVAYNITDPIPQASSGSGGTACGPSSATLGEITRHDAFSETQTITPTAIILHWWGGGGGIDSLISTLQTRGLSVQFATTEDGKNHQLTAQPNSIAYHAKCANNWGIGIEIEGGRPSQMGPDPQGSGKTVALDLANNQTQFNAVVQLTGQLMKQFNIPLDGVLATDGNSGSGVQSHKLVDSNCPNPSGKPDVDDVYLGRVKEELRKQGF